MPLINKGRNYMGDLFIDMVVKMCIALLQTGS